MSDVFLPMATTWLNAAVFATVGAMNLAGIRAARQMYERWNVPTVTYRIIGVIDLIAAVFLVEPDTRAWGILLAASIAFGSAVLLISHYACAVVPTLVLVALVPAMLAVPRDDHRPHYPISQ
jgi:DoxX-like family